MHPIFEEKNSLDTRCYDTFKLSPEILMEHAGLALAKAVKKKLTCKTKALFICGPGNNGADGIVAARLLYPKYNVSLFLPYTLSSTLAQLQYERALSIGVPVVTEFTTADIYIDALFGSGLNRALDEQSLGLKAWLTFFSYTFYFSDLALQNYPFL